MKAVIMAGGEGSRLRPLTHTVPKPMVPLCGRPILEYVLDLLADHGFTQALITLRYLPQVIESHFSEGEYRGVALTFVREEKPLGTAGGVKNACPRSEEPILVISGDALCDFDLTAAMDFHRSRPQSGVTILVKRVEDVRAYGQVQTGPEGLITGFAEKPPYAQPVEGVVSTGVYILSPHILDRIPTGRPWDFARDLFPALMIQGEPLLALEQDCYWRDVGNLPSYEQAQQDILEQRVRCRSPIKVPLL